MADEFDAVRAKLSQVLQSAISLAAPGTTVHYENLPSTPPVNEPWVHFSIAPNYSKRKNIGLSPRRFVHAGVVIVNVMAPQNSGTKALNGLVEIAFYALADQNFNLNEHGYLRLCYATRRNRGTINGYNVGNVQVEYYHEVDHV